MFSSKGPRMPSIDAGVDAGEMSSEPRIGPEETRRLDESARPIDRERRHATN